MLEHEHDHPVKALRRIRKLVEWTFGAATLERDIVEFGVAILTQEGLGSRVPQDSNAAIRVVGMQNTDLRQWLVAHAEQLRKYEEATCARIPNERARASRSGETTSRS